VADVIDALLSDRPYRPALRREDAFELVAEGVGAQFDPAVAVPALEHAEVLIA
jgi:HD-GYP domain-containing protein (c-di-GMP phosphodiesterase class II)